MCHRSCRVGARAFLAAGVPITRAEARPDGRSEETPDPIRQGFGMFTFCVVRPLVQRKTSGGGKHFAEREGQPPASLMQ
jgi:hypothetical protein